MELHPSWIWMALAAGFIIGEIFTAGFFLLWFGIGAAAAGGLALLGLGPAWQWATFVALSLLLFLASRRFADRFTRRQPPGIGADRYVSRSGVVVEDIDGASAIGRVRLGSETWRAMGADGAAIPAGTAVTVVRVDGAALVVTPADGAVKETH